MDKLYLLILELKPDDYANKKIRIKGKQRKFMLQSLQICVAASLNYTTKTA